MQSERSQKRHSHSQGVRKETRGERVKFERLGCGGEIWWRKYESHCDNVSAGFRVGEGEKGRGGEIQELECASEGVGFQI